MCAIGILFGFSIFSGVYTSSVPEPPWYTIVSTVRASSKGASSMDPSVIMDGDVLSCLSTDNDDDLPLVSLEFGSWHRVYAWTIGIKSRSNIGNLGCAGGDAENVVLDFNNTPSPDLTPCPPSTSSSSEDTINGVLIKTKTITNGTESLISYKKVVYIYQIEAGFEICEIGVDGMWVPAPTPTPSPAPPQTAFIVSLDCRDRLAVSGNDGNHPACNTVGFKQKPTCEIRNADDMKALSANVRISGDAQMPWPADPSTPLVCAPLSMKLYYCVEANDNGQGAGDLNACPFMSG